MKIGSVLLAAIGLALGAPSPGPVEPDAVAAASGRFCSPVTQLCYTEYKTVGMARYRIAISDSANSSPFDIAFQIVAPKQVSWAGLAWGGAMINSPLTLGWPNYSNGVTLSSRYTT